MKKIVNSLQKMIGSFLSAPSGSGRQRQRQPHTNVHELPPFNRQTWWLYFDTGLQVLRNLLITAIVSLVILGSLGLGIGLGYFASIIDKTPVPTKTALRRSVNNAATSATMYYANDVVLADVKSDLIRKTVSLDQISPWVQKGVVATEDVDFFNHRGVMPKSLLRAVLSTVTGLGSQTGGSTLTQQLVKMQLLSSETTFKRKAQEIMLARRVDKYMTKQEVLAAYLNTATLGRNNKGQNIAGVEAAAMGIFGVHASDLNLPEAAFIAGLPQSPFGYTPYDTDGRFVRDLTPGLTRQKVVLFRMYRAGFITEKEYRAARAFNLKARFKQQGSRDEQSQSTDYAYNTVFAKAQTIIAERLARQDDLSVKKMKDDANLYNQYMGTAATLLRTKGYQIHSTLIKPVYDKMQETVANYANNFGQGYTYTYTDPTTGETKTTTERPQNGTVLLDNQTGAILGFVGGTDAGVNHTLTLRSPGSTIKPLITYGPAIENRLIGSNTALADFKTHFGSYKVTDFDSKIQNRFVPATQALAWSYNIPAVNLYNLVQKHVDVKSYMEKMGVTTFTKNDYSQLGLGIGGTDYGVSVSAQASAFSTFANEGQHVNSYMIDRITDQSGKVIYQHKVKPTRVFSKETAYILQKMMRSVLTEGTATTVSANLAFSDRAVFGKTGTSNDFRDIWFIGSTPGVTMASWLGYDNNYGHTYNMSANASSVNEQYWAEQMNAIYKLIPKRLRLGQKMKRPSGVKSVMVNAQTGYPNGTVTYKGTPFTLSGNTIESLYNGSLPGRNIPTRFAIGGASADYALFYDHLLGISNGYGVVTVGNNDATESQEATAAGTSDSATEGTGYYQPDTTTTDTDVSTSDIPDIDYGTTTPETPTTPQATPDTPTTSTTTDTTTSDTTTATPDTGAGDTVVGP